MVFEDPESNTEGTIVELNGVAFIEALKELRQRVAGLSTRDPERQSARSKSLHNDCAPIMRLLNHELVCSMALLLSRLLTMEGWWTSSIQSRLNA